MMGEQHGYILGLMTPCSNNYYKCVFTLSTSMMDYLYIPMFGNGDFGNNWISCLASWLDDIPWSSWNTSLWDSINCCVYWHYLPLHPSKNSFISSWLLLLTTFSLWRTTRKTYLCCQWFSFPNKHYLDRVWIYSHLHLWHIPCHIWQACTTFLSSWRWNLLLTSIGFPRWLCIRQMEPHLQPLHSQSYG